jgi:hypothetical protein
LLMLGPNVVWPGKLELVLTLCVALLENYLICCQVLLHCLNLRLTGAFVIPFGCISICSSSGNGDGPISCILFSENWCKLVVENVGLFLWVFPPFVNGTTPVESHLLHFMNDHKRLVFDFMSSFSIVLT